MRPARGFFGVALVCNLELVQVVAKGQSVFQTEQNDLTVKHRFVNVYQGIFYKGSIRTSAIMKFSFQSR